MTSFIKHYQKSYRQQVWNQLLGRLATLGLLYSLGWSKLARNFDHGFWLIQKLDCSTNLPKNPIILWSNFFALGSLSYDEFLKIHLFSSDNAQCIIKPCALGQMLTHCCISDCNIFPHSNPLCQVLLHMYKSVRSNNCIRQ